jgi:hypothetical protein
LKSLICVTLRTKIYKYGRRNQRAHFCDQVQSHEGSISLRHITFGRLEERRFTSKRKLLLRLNLEAHINDARFCMYQRDGLMVPLPSIVLFLVDETTYVPRIVAQEQNGNALTELLCKEYEYATNGSALTLLEWSHN